MSQSERPGRALVLGGGTMGVGIIAMFLGGGWKVDVVSRSASTRDGLPAATAQGAGRAWASRPTPRGSTTYATLAEAPWPKIDLVVETVTEDLALKQQTLRRDGGARAAGLRAHLEFLELPDQRDRQGPEDAGPHDGAALLHAGAPDPAGRGRALRPHRLRPSPSRSARS